LQPILIESPPGGYGAPRRSALTGLHLHVVMGRRRAYFAGHSRLCRRLLAGSDPVTPFLPPLAPYPQTSLRRDRRAPWSAKLVAESVLTSGHLLWPVCALDEDRMTPISSMPGVSRLPITALVDAAGEASELGIPTVAVFPAVPSGLNDAEGGEA